MVDNRTVEPPTTSPAAPRPPRAKLTAEPPVGAGIILVRQTPDGSFAWATGSTATKQTATGTAADETTAHLAALEAFLAHPDHTGRRLTLDVEDNPAGHEVVRFITQHLPQIPVTARKDLHVDAAQIFPEVWDALPDVSHVPQDPPRVPVRVIAATGATRQAGHPEGGWAWVSSDGRRWETGAIRGRKLLAIELIAVLRLIAAHPSADTIHVGCDSKQAIALIQQLRDGRTGVNATVTDLKLQHPKYLKLFDVLLNHHAEITFQWVPPHDGHLLAQTANRLAIQECLALQSPTSKETLTGILARILTEFRASLPDT